jgi:hypothetical protein
MSFSRSKVDKKGKSVIYHQKKNFRWVWRCNYCGWIEGAIFSQKTYLRRLRKWIQSKDWQWTKTTDNRISFGYNPKWVNEGEFRALRDKYIKYINVPSGDHYWILIYKPLLNRLRRIRHIEQAMQWIFTIPTSQNEGLTRFLQNNQEKR